MSRAYAGAMPSFADLLAERPVLLADGATGTNYQDMGIEPGVAPEEWVFDAPEHVRELHRRFADAGSDLVLTCSFGATTPRLADGPLAGRTREVNIRAAELARAAVGEERLVAGSMGPTGQLVEPYGPLTREVCVEAYAEQAQALSDGGVDLLVLETFFALEEALWAIEGVQSATDLPLVASFSFDQGTRTMMGLSPTDVVAAVEPLGVAALGANCGRSLEDTDAIVAELLAASSGIPLWIKPNAGVPRIIGDAVVYEADPETLAQHIRGYADQGARIVGGCCGTTPEHIAAIARALALARRVGDERGDRRRELSPALLPGVEHVPAAEVPDGQAVRHLRVEPHEVSQPVARVVRRHEVVPPVRDERLHVRVERHAVPEVVGRADGRHEEVLLGVVLPGLVHLVAQDRVLAIRVDADLRAKLPVDRHRVRGADPCERGIGPGERLPVGERIGHRDRRVVEAEHLPLVAEQLACEHADRDSALGAGDHVRGEPDEIGEPGENAIALGRRHRGAAGEERRVVAGGEHLGLAQDVVERSSRGERA